ncbi:MAG: hypothetical protein JKY60_09975 [Kordiimonadaceae bacterium]|nr:hypothetical protein [Kordiimonadaceae bacterium]
MSTAEAVASDQTNQRQLAEIIGTVGWPIEKHFGTEAASAAGLVAIHAILNPELQAEILILMRLSLEKEEMDFQGYALLYDKIARSKGDKLQRYGTQGFCNAITQEFEIYPIDPQYIDTVHDVRRKGGMLPLKEYAEITKSFLCGTYMEWTFPKFSPAPLE